MLKVVALLTAFVFLACSEQPAQHDRAAVRSKFHPGQVWRYRTRPGEEQSRLVVGRVESDPTVGTVVHIKIVGVSVRNPAVSTGVQNDIPHVPILATALDNSVIDTVDEHIDLDGFEYGYETWKSHTGGNAAGFFDVPVSEIITYAEETLSHQAG